MAVNINRNVSSSISIGSESDDQTRIERLEYLSYREIAPLVTEIKKAVNSSLGSITEVSSDLTIDGTYQYIVVDATDGNVTITLPSADQWYMPIEVKKTNSSGGNVIIAVDGSDTIDGASSVTITTQYDSKTLVSNESTKWWVF